MARFASSSPIAPGDGGRGEVSLGMATGLPNRAVVPSLDVAILGHEGKILQARLGNDDPIERVSGPRFGDSHLGYGRLRR